MKQKDEEVLLKDICSRLPYNVNIQYKDFKPIALYSIDEYCINGTYRIEFCKPYLRPLWSMTEKEKEEAINGIVECQNNSINLGSVLMPSVEQMVYIMDWLNAHHFDYHGLIEKGLAIEVTEKNNPYKE